MLIEQTILPNRAVKFSQPSQYNKCSPKEESIAYKQGQRYPFLVPGQKREDTYERRLSKFKLNVPYDALGVPNGPKFCGNTIIVNAKTFNKYLQHYKPHNYRGWRVSELGHRQRNVEIDTRTVPQYNDVNLGSWKQWGIKDQDAKELQCEPDSDKISIDEMPYLNVGGVKIYTGAGKDVLTISGEVGSADLWTGRRGEGNFFVAYLGEVCQ